MPVAVICPPLVAIPAHLRARFPRLEAWIAMPFNQSGKIVGTLNWTVIFVPFSQSGKQGAGFMAQRDPRVRGAQAGNVPMPRDDD
jgi:hypothetical protein